MTIYPFMEEQTLNPEWDKAGKVHDWRNYATDEIKRLWPTFSEEQKLAIIEMLDDLADREHWD